MTDFCILYEDREGAECKTGPLTKEEVKEYFELLTKEYINVRIIKENWL